jgi:diguanylate cyclase (GGDEF)-like protein
LIVGARVLGTLACWSTEAHNFDADDERILELMAAQVASAVAAADMHETTERKASLDALTGLPNRRQFLNDLPEAQQSLIAGHQLAAVMIDVDHFKRFNDDFGHRVGDVTLQKVAEVMSGAIREGDQIYRYGGEEFLLLLPGIAEADALRLVERMLRSIAKTPLTGENLEPVGPVTISAGLAVGPEHASDLLELIRLADVALYQSKANGRNRVSVAPAPAGLDEVA